MITTLMDEIKRVLKKSKKPMTAKQITEEIKKRKNYKFFGKTPISSVCARIITDIKKKEEKSFFIRLNEGLFDLREK